MTTDKEIEVHRTQYRLPKPMANWLKEKAAAHYRSMNAELLEIIREAMAKDCSNEQA